MSRSFVGTVKPFNHLLERTEFFGNNIIVGKSNDLGDTEFKGISKFIKELRGSKRMPSAIKWKFLGVS